MGWVAFLGDGCLNMNYDAGWQELIFPSNNLVPAYASVSPVITSQICQGELSIECHPGPPQSSSVKSSG